MLLTTYTLWSDERTRWWIVLFTCCVLGSTGRCRPLTDRQMLAQQLVRHLAGNSNIKGVKVLRSLLCFLGFPRVFRRVRSSNGNQMLKYEITDNDRGGGFLGVPLPAGYGVFFWKFSEHICISEKQLIFEKRCSSIWVGYFETFLFSTPLVLIWNEYLITTRTK